jgi:Ca2+-binding RTX toxin-like protein
MRARIAIALALVATLAVAAPALATIVTSVRYAPPKITVLDFHKVGTQEDLVVTKDGAEYSFSQPSGLVKDSDSEPGCTDMFNTDYRCPVAGIKKIVVKLGLMDDGVAIDLASKATKVKQILRGGPGEDTLTGGPGPQRSYGDQGPDTITGGPGPDFIDGGGGTDTCTGGPGHDTIRHCE